MSKPSSFAHVVFQTRKVDEVISWYQTALGFDVRFQHPALTFLSFDEEHHRIALINLEVIDPEGKRPLNSATGTLEHIAFTFANATDLLNNYVRLKALGIEPFWCVHHGMTLSMYYQDPDGNRVEFQVEVYDSADAANNFLSTEVFAKNPIGVEFEAGELVTLMENGADEAELVKYTPGPMAMPPGA